MTATAVALLDRDATAYRAEDEAIERAEATLRQALAGTWTWGAAVEIRDACEAVREAIEIHEALRARVLGWEAYDPDLREYADPHDIAVQRSAEDAEDAAGYLAEVIGKHNGEQAASAAIKGES